jgi:hypothetical protein
MGRRRAGPLVLLLAVLAPAASMAEDHFTCTTETFTTVCRSGARELRVVEDTASPSRQYAVAWEVPAGARALKTESDGSKHLDGGAADNFLVRLDTGKVVTKLAGTHYGDHARYNHFEVAAVWSPDSRFVAVVYQSKWMTDVAAVYRLSAEGTAGKPLDLLPICRDVGRGREGRLRGKAGENYAHTVDVHAVGKDAIVSAKCGMQVIKQDDNFSFAIRLKLDPRHDALAARLIGARRCTNDRGPCAEREPHE